MSTHTFTMACPVRSCDDGVLTVEISGRYVEARGFDPPESPELAILAATCGHLDEAWEHSDFERNAMEALRD